MSKRILLADDELHILRAAEFKFKRAGYEVFCAEDGEQAWEQVLTHRPHLLVTDYQMPRLDGLQLVARLRAHPETTDLPIIMLTAKGFEMPRSEISKRYRITAVLMKPFSPRELHRQVEQALATTFDLCGNLLDSTRVSTETI